MIDLQEITFLSEGLLQCRCCLKLLLQIDGSFPCNVQDYATTKDTLLTNRSKCFHYSVRMNTLQMTSLTCGLTQMF